MSKAELILFSAFFVAFIVGCIDIICRSVAALMKMRSE